MLGADGLAAPHRATSTIRPPARAGPAYIAPMSTGFAVVPDELRLSAGVAADVGSTLGRLPLGDAVAAVPDAMPGGGAAAAAARLAQAWSAALTDLGSGLTRHAGTLDECGRAYETADADAAARLGS